ncbi:MAG: permease-like cell division protein FtsX [Candidatus Saccharimonadales bacterium]
MSAKKADRTKIRESKVARRRYLTWLRMIRYGVNNFTRNAWLTTAATAVMTITLLVILTTMLARTLLTETVTKLVREETKPSIYLRGETPPSDVAAIKQKIGQIDNVSAVDVFTAEAARDDYITKNKITDPQDLQALAESGITFPVTLTMTLKNTDDISALQDIIKNNQLVSSNLYDGVDQLNSTNRGAIGTLNDWARTSERVGIVATVLFTGISMLIVFNTIRMAIFNRKEEIDMMKLIGADKSFIRGPFVVEAVMYGFIAALLATGISYFALVTFKQPIADYGIAIDELLPKLMMLSPVILLGVIVLGACIGIISARLAVRRYLKV